MQTPDPTTAELLDRITTRLLEQDADHFSERWERTRARCCLHISGLLATARLLARIDTQRAALAQTSR